MPAIFLPVLRCAECRELFVGTTTTCLQCQEGKATREDAGDAKNASIRRRLGLPSVAGWGCSHD